jgi:hypothetical protein
MFKSFRNSFALGALMALAISGQAFATHIPSHPTTLALVGTITAGSPVWVAMPGVTDNPDGCTNSGIYILQTSNPNFGNLYSALLAASASGKNVGFFLSGCLDVYNIGMTWPIITGIQYSP